MSIRNLDKLFKPRRIAVIGASNTPNRVGYNVLSNLIGSGFRGVVYPVNPHTESVQGICAYTNVVSLPRTPDLAILCTPAPTVPGLVRECGEAGIGGLLIIAAGFREIGKEGRMLEEAVREAQRNFDGLRIIGPNSCGIIVPSLHLNASFASPAPKPGHLAFISQSGSLSRVAIDWAQRTNQGFSFFVSTGHMLDVDFSDLIDYFGADPNTRAIIMYLQYIQRARKFMSAARSFARTKPIVAYKSGWFDESARFSASHTGTMTSEDDVYRAALNRAGIVRVWQTDDIFDCAELLRSQRPPQGEHLAIITNASSPAVIATDFLLHRHATLATFSEHTLAQLDAELPPYWSRGNPADLLRDASPELFAKVVAIVLEDKGVDAVLVILVPWNMTDPAATAARLVEITGHAKKPVLAAWLGGGERVLQGMRILKQGKIPVYSTPENAVRAYMHLVDYARNLEILYETPKDIPVSFKLKRRKLRKRLTHILNTPLDVITEGETKNLLSAYGIPVCPTRIAHSPDEAVHAAKRIGYPVVLKVVSPAILHKIDVGGVALNLRNDEQVRYAYDTVLTAAGTWRPDAKVEGVTVQKMVNHQNSRELILGTKKDPTFGAVIMVGIGGIATGVFRDHALGLPPLNECLARRMLESLRSWPLLQGYRGRPGVNMDRLIETLIRFSYLVADFPEIRELDINPVLATPEEVVVLDAAMVIDSKAAARIDWQPYEHLAIRPYPEEYVRHRHLKDDTPIMLRPIKPEDEPLWHALLASASPESIRFRFRSLFKHTTHEMATRHCFIDYDRQMSIVAETEADGSRRLIGVGGLEADADHESAEFAVIVADPWQNKGLGSMLLDYCTQIAHSWGVKQLVAETDPANQRMLSMFESRGFTAKRDLELDTVFLQKSI